MKLYAVVDEKSSVAEYFIASCKEDACRIWFVMAVSSRPMYEFLEDYVLEEVCDLPGVRKYQEAKVALVGSSLKRMIDVKRKENENANKDEV